MATKKITVSSRKEMIFDISNKTLFSDFVMNKNPNFQETFNLKSTPFNDNIRNSHQESLLVKNNHSPEHNNDRSLCCYKSNNCFRADSTKFLECCNSRKENPTKKKVKSASSANNSTLSLHIAAYENSNGIQNASDSLEIKVKSATDFRRIKKSVKQFTHESNIHKFFEFPRQQNEHITDPEILQFKASQKLLNPNASNSIGSIHSSSNSEEHLKDAAESLHESSLQNQLEVPEKQDVFEPDPMQKSDSQSLADALAGLSINAGKKTMENDVPEVQKVSARIPQPEPEQETPSQKLADDLAELSLNDRADEKTTENEMPERQIVFPRVAKLEPQQNISSQELADELAELSLENRVDEKTTENEMPERQIVAASVPELPQKTSSQKLADDMAEMSLDDRKRTIKKEIPEEPEAPAPIIQLKPFQKTASQILSDLLDKMTLHDKIIIDEKAMELNAHLYKDGFFDLNLNDVGRNDSEAFSHSTFWKYSKHKFPSDSFINKVWYHNAKNVPQMHWYCADTFVATYIDQHLESLQRWIYRQRLEEMEVMFLNKQKKIVISHCIYFAEPERIGVALTKIPNFTKKVKQLREHFGIVLHRFERTPAFNVDLNELHEFKIVCKFRRSVVNKTRDGEHEWKEAADYMPLSKNLNGGSVSNRMKYATPPIRYGDDEDDEGKESGEDEDDAEIKKIKVEEIPKKVIKVEKAVTPEKVVKSEKLETPEKAIKTEYEIPEKAVKTEEAEIKDEMGTIDGSDKTDETEETEEIEVFEKKEEVCGLQIEYRCYFPNPSEQNLLNSGDLKLSQQ